MMTITPPETSWTTTTLTGRKKLNTHMSAADVEEEEEVPVPQCENTSLQVLHLKLKVKVQLLYFTLYFTETVVFSKIDIFFCNLNVPSVFSVFPVVFYFSEFPPIANEQVRSNYKREFDREHQEYKDLQAELDAINKDLADIDRELDELQEGSPQYLVRAHRKKSVFIHYLLYHVFVFIHE